MSHGGAIENRSRIRSKRWRWLALVVISVVIVVFLINTNLLSRRPEGSPSLLAHRGVAQRFDTRDLKADTCTAARMLPPRHNYLENTLPSIQRSFELGASVVELDVHPTTDRQFAVFHDWTVDCRTDGHGVTREHSMTELKTLDVGYGYTADGGRTFPFRGRGVGLMPSLSEVLAAFPQGSFLINVKSADPEEGELLASYLATLSPERRDRLMVYGAEPPLAVIRARLPDIRVMSRRSLEACMVRYVGYGWTGFVPPECRRMLVIVPINIAPWLWGWPDRFLDRMESVGSRVFVQGDYTGGWSVGINSKSDLERLPKGYTGGILTDEIELVAPLAAQRGRLRP